MLSNLYMKWLFWMHRRLKRRERLARPLCCGACPPIEGGGYDCVCLYSKRCPRRKETSMIANWYRRFAIWSARILTWDHKRKKGKR